MVTPLMTEKPTAIIVADNSPAIVQSGFYAALAGHLADHDTLCPVSSTETGLQVQCPRSRAATELVTWADSLDGDLLVEVKNINDGGHCYLRFGRIGGWDDDIVVHAVVPGLSWVMGDVFVKAHEWEQGGTAWITVDSLRKFAETGERPEPVAAPVF
jgi:hypothetical protein